MTLGRSVGTFLLIASIAAVTAQAQQSYSRAQADRYLQTGDWAHSLEYANGWARVAPNDAEPWYYLGLTYFVGQKRSADALAAFKRAVVLKPDWASAWYFLGSASIEMKQWAGAHDALTRAIQLMPQQMVYRLKLAEVHKYLKDLNSARAVLRQAKNDLGATANAEDWSLLAVAHLSMYDCGDAGYAYQRAVQQNPGARREAAAGFNAVGRCEESIGRRQNALAYYRQAAALGDAKGARNADALQSATDSHQQIRRETDNMKILDQEREDRARQLSEDYRLSHPMGTPNPYDKR